MRDLLPGFDTGMDTMASCLLILLAVILVAGVVAIGVLIIQGTYEWLDSRGLPRVERKATVVDKTYTPASSGIRMQTMISTTYANGQATTTTTLVPIPYQDPPNWNIEVRLNEIDGKTFDLDIDQDLYGRLKTGEGVIIGGVIGRWSKTFRAQDVQETE